LYVPLTFYLDALVSFNVEARYLLLQVALESFAFWLSKGRDAPKPQLVEKSKWKEWLSANRDAIIALGTDPTSGQSLLNQITSIPGRTPASRVVEGAFTRLGLTLTPEMTAELGRGRGGIVHRAAMFDDREESLDAYLSRIAIVRTMLVALVARVVGYSGAILGWKREPQRPYQPPRHEWWPVDPAAQSAAFERFCADD
jgi:hypothetical protein